jgi:hypothetical protein
VAHLNVRVSTDEPDSAELDRLKDAAGIEADDGGAE